MSALWATMAPILGAYQFIQTINHAVIPTWFRFFVCNFFQRLYKRLSPHVDYQINDSIDGVNTNELYDSVQLYLSNSAATSTATTSNSLSLTRGVNSSVIDFALTNNGCLHDMFNGVNVVWEQLVKESPKSFRSDEKRGLKLRMAKPNYLKPYLDFITDKANEIRANNRDRLLFTNSGSKWRSVPFKHPSTFQTLAMDPVKKDEIKSDLQDFSDGQAFYERTGRAWKRGYLLYGPPGTGKSSMIAAMSNHLKYDIYDLELTAVETNSELRTLLMKTTSKSIIVVEDIDCSVNLTDSKNHAASDIISGERKGNNNVKGAITLSGLLNFTDGLWSCCGSERIFVFTTNYIEKLDPALLRSGRMDMHVFMGYCSFPALKILLKSYLDCDEGEVEINGVLEDVAAVIDEAEMTPADVSEVLIKNRRDKNMAVRELLEALKKRVMNRRPVEAEMAEEEVVEVVEEKSPKEVGGSDQVN